MAMGGTMTLQQAANGPFHSHIHLGNAHFDVAVGALLGEVNVVYADDFAAVGIDDLLIEQIFVDGEPCFIGLIELEGGLIGR